MLQTYFDYYYQNSQPLVNIEEEVFVFPASFAQQRLWFIDQLIPNNYFYNVPTTLRLKGKLKIAALKRAIHEIVQRHETLRTNFHMMENEVLQVIAPSVNLQVKILSLEELPLQKRESEAMKLLMVECERPFKLSSEPLLRVVVIHLSETEHFLLLNLHHIVCDDWSIGVFIKELTTLYTVFTRAEIGYDVSQILPELPLQYADFSEWQREWFQGEVLENQLKYWREKLQGISRLDLPTDRPKPLIQTHQGATEYLELSPSLMEALEAFSQQEGVTLFMILLAAFKTLLYRYTHQKDIVIGSPIANRNRSEIENLIGFFVNTLVLRTDFSDQPTFRELLAQIKAVTLEAYAHQDLPFEKLVEELQPERNLRENPLFQVIFGFENAPMDSLEMPDLEVSFANLELRTTRFDLEFHLWKCTGGFRELWGGDRWQYSQGIRGVIVYNTDLFDRETITRMLGHFTTLLEQGIANPNQKVSHLAILTEAEKHQLLFAWNQTQTDYPKHHCIHQLFEAQVEQNPDAIAATFGTEQITYQDLNIRSNQLAHYLRKAGVKADVLVGVCLEPGIEMLLGFLGILKAGGAYLPLDPNYPPERLKFMIEDAQVSLVLTQTSIFSNLSQGLENLPIFCFDQDWNQISENTTENLSNQTTTDNLAYVIYTSGSTGTPKGVAVPHKAVNRLVCNTNYIKLESTDRMAQVSNLSFDAATFEIWGALLNGAQLIGMDRDLILSPQSFAAQIQHHQITILFLTTALFQQMVRLVPEAFASLRYLLFGGENIDIRWVKKLLKQGAPQNLIHVYGPTENTTFSSYYFVEDVSEFAHSLPIGRPISNSQIYLLDEQLQPVPIGITGEICLSGDGLAQGYLNRSELTAEKFIAINNAEDRGECGVPILNRQQSTVNSQPSTVNSQPSTVNTLVYKTGDLARYLPDGNIKFLGRLDDQVKIRGFRIELGEVEAVLSQYPAVAEVVVQVQEEIPGDKQLVAYLVPEKQETIKSSDLRQFMKQKLPDYMIPSAYIPLESLPLTPNGKIDYKSLPKIDIFNFEAEENCVRPRTNLEVRLVEIWSKILGKQILSVHDNFFDLGGHSLLATQLVSRIRDNFKIELPVRSLFESPTVASLAQYIETLIWANKSSNQTDIQNKKREEVEL